MPGKSELQINEKFAQKYERYRQKEELQRLKDRYGDEADDGESGSSDSDSDEDSDVELDPKLEKDFYRTLSLLKKKDPKIYQLDAKFYTPEDTASSSDVQPSTSKTREKPMFLKDYERKVILEREGKYEDDEDEIDENILRRKERAASPSYIQEQKELKESFRKFVQDSDEEDAEGDGSSQLLTRRNKTQEEKDKEEADYMEWLKGQAELNVEEELQDMKYLKDYWNDPELDERERFLRDYVLNKGYLDEDEDRIPTYDELVQEEVEDSEEEGGSFLERQEDFERQYNFRFEEPDSQQIKTYPRNIATSVRAKDERRKHKREEVKERKKKEKEQKQQQLKQLKKLKQKEIMEKLRKLQELTGNEQLAFSQADLEGDFDPQHHDQLMQKFFGDEYYGEEEDEKPHFEQEDMDEHWNWDTWTGEADEEGGEEELEGNENDQPYCEDPDFNMDADYDPSQAAASSKKQKRKERKLERKKMMKDDAPLMGKKRKKSHFASIITRSKPVFDPEEKSFEQYLDEYYQLDYEDIIDDLPCRFRYRHVVPNDFGLTTEEILAANDKDLNRWCSLKKTCMYRTQREELSDVKNYKMKAASHSKKKSVLSSLFTASDDVSEEQASGKAKVGKKRRDRLRKAGMMKKEEANEEEHTDPVQETLTEARGEESEEEEFLVPKKKAKTNELTDGVGELKQQRPTGRLKKPRRKRGLQSGRLLSGPLMVRVGGRDFSGQRLKAYGLNPKRLHYRQLNRQKRKSEEKKKTKNTES